MKQIMKKIAHSYPEIDSVNINSILNLKNETYFGGVGLFCKMDNKGNLVKILSGADKNLDGYEGNLFDILFGGTIYNLEHTAEYPNLINFVSNNSGALSVFYNPNENEFYMAPRIVKKSYKLTDNKIIDAEIPEFAKEDNALFKWWSNKYKIFSKE
jgi:hypothetical protein